MDLRTLVVVIAILALAGYVKGVIAFGFPLVATPLLALATDVPTAIAVSLLPNIAMDLINATRGAGLRKIIARQWPLFLTGSIATIGGTHLLLLMSPKVLFVLLGIIVFAYVALRGTNITINVSVRHEKFFAAPVGLVAGLLNGAANSSGLPLALYYSFLRMPKMEFVKTIAVTFIFFKTIQFITLFKLTGMSSGLLSTSLIATGFTLLAFRAGVWTQDRVSEKHFQKAILVFLVLSGIAMLGKAVTS